MRFVSLSFLGLLLLVGACATPKPYVSVLGVSQSTSAPLVVVVEIHNPTRTPIRLSALDYSFAAGQESRGRVPLRQVIAPGRSSVVPIAVPVDVEDQRGETYRLVGSLRGYAGDTQVSFRVVAGGELSAVAVGTAGTVAFVAD